jgi:glutathione S-transferase
MPIRMYDLAAAEADRRFSPYCWRTKLALAHKQLEVETIPWRLGDKPLIAFANWERVPVIVDQSKPVVDSWAIATYLENTYPARPSLFGGPAGLGLARFYNVWADTVLNPALTHFLVLDVYNRLAPSDQPYFRRNREDRYGVTLEEYCKNREERLPAFKQLLEPLRQTLATQLYFGGEMPLYPDYIVFGSIMWPRCISPFRLLDAGDPINEWSERLLGAFGAILSNAPRYW